MTVKDDLRQIQSAIQGLNDLLGTTIERLELREERQYQEIVALTNQRDEAQVMVRKYAKQIEELVS